MHHTLLAHSRRGSCACGRARPPSSSITCTQWHVSLQFPGRNTLPQFMPLYTRPARTSCSYSPTCTPGRSRAVPSTWIGARRARRTHSPARNRTPHAGAGPGPCPGGAGHCWPRCACRACGRPRLPRPTGSCGSGSRPPTRGRRHVPAPARPSAPRGRCRRGGGSGPRGGPGGCGTVRTPMCQARVDGWWQDQVIIGVGRSTWTIGDDLAWKRCATSYLEHVFPTQRQGRPPGQAVRHVVQQVQQHGHGGVGAGQSLVGGKAQGTRTRVSKQQNAQAQHPLCKSLLKIVAMSAGHVRVSLTSGMVSCSTSRTSASRRTPSPPLYDERLSRSLSRSGPAPPGCTRLRIARTTCNSHRLAVLLVTRAKGD